MAPPAAEPRQRFAAWLASQLSPEPGRLAFAVKLATICGVTALAAALYRTPEPALAAYVAFFMNVRDRATSLILEVVLTFCVAILILIVMLTAVVVLDHPAWRVAAIAGLSLAFLFLGSASKLKPLAATFGLIVAYALDKLGQVQVGEEATRELLYAWLFVAMPALASIAFNVLVGLHPRRMATSELARRLRVGSSLLMEPSEKARDEVARGLADGAAEIRHWLKLAKAELGARPQDLVRLNQATSSALEILAALDLLDRYETLPANLRQALAQELRDMAVILDRGGYPAEIAFDPPPWPDASPVGREALAGIRRAILGFADPPAETPAAVGRQGGFFVADAFSNPMHLQYASKITAAALFCYLLYSLLHWPGIHTCFLTCYIVGLGTVGESVEKLALRLGGAAVGAAAGLVALLFVMPHVVSAGGLFIVIFIGALAAGYVAAGSPRISYVGFQMAFAFFLCTLEGAAPNFDMRTIRDRLIGILIGNVVIYLVSTRLWPTSISGRIDRALAATLRALGAAVRSPAHTGRPEQASGVFAGLEKIEADLDLAGYEPAPLRAQDAWLLARRIGTEEIASIQTAVLVAAELEIAPQLSARLEALAERIEANPRSGQLLAPQVPAARGINGIIDENMRRLETALSGAAEDGAHAPA